MKILVTGSSGHLGGSLVRTLRDADHGVVGLDRVASPFTDTVGSIGDTGAVRACLAGVDAVLHTATHHKPHVATHDRQAFVDTDLSGTLTLLAEAVRARLRRLVFTGTTGAFGDALSPPRHAPAAWITEDVAPRPKNIHGATKTAADDLCQPVRRNQGLACVVPRTPRFCPEADDEPARRDAHADANLKVDGFLHRHATAPDAAGGDACAGSPAAAALR